MKPCHQPTDEMSCAGSSDVISRPSVGISHAIAMATSTMLTGAWLRARVMLRPTPSRGTVSTGRMSGSSMCPAAVAISPPFGSGAR